MSKKFALLSSTNVSVVKAVFSITERTEFDLNLVIADRDCGALKFALKENIEAVRIDQKSNLNLSNQILKVLQEKKIDYVYVFFTRILCGELLNVFHEKLINFHPSLLPAFPGLHGFEDTIASGALIAGSTTHYIDAGIDTGAKLIQSTVSIPGKNIADIRHIIFSQQCAALFEIHSKLTRKSDANLAENEINNLSMNFIPDISSRSLEIYKRICALKSI